MKNSRGQLLLPILAVIFLFGFFWIPYVLRCQRTYWKMRMDAAADLVAISTARERAGLLNTMATIQTMQTPLVPRVKGAGLANVGVMPQFELWNGLLRSTETSFKSLVYAVGMTVARLNQSNRPILPMVGSSLEENLSAYLSPQPFKVLYIVPGGPPVVRRYRQGFFVRQWSPRTLKAQPVHENHWLVCRGTICGQGQAKLWLDVEDRSALNNGGFPSSNASWLRSVGFQCFYPQFNACLLPKP